jgi:rhodanese-related sulfurtransferase/CBS domain-containing protein
VAERIDTEAVRALVDQGAALVEVLPPSAYNAEHLPGAVNIPLPDLTPDAVKDLDPKRPTIVYCYDYQCDLSARGARRLETLGFGEVYDYAASKVAWFSAGLPAEGSVPDSARAGAVARTDVPRCALDTTVGDLAEIIKDHRRAVVVDADGIVLGLVRREALALPDDTRAEAVMQPAPPTVRPAITVDELAESMDKDGRTYVLVSHFDGVLVGLIEREDLYGGH